MRINVTVDEKLFNELERKAELLGLSVSGLVNFLVNFSLVNENLKKMFLELEGKDETIETLKEENEQLKERLQISPFGDDKIDELEEAIENLKFQYDQLKKENEKLKDGKEK